MPVSRKEFIAICTALKPPGATLTKWCMMYLRNTLMDMLVPIEEVYPYLQHFFSNAPNTDISKEYIDEFCSHGIRVNGREPVAAQVGEASARAVVQGRSNAASSPGTGASPHGQVEAPRRDHVETRGQVAAAAVALVQLEAEASIRDQAAPIVRGRPSAAEIAPDAHDGRGRRFAVAGEGVHGRIEVTGRDQVFSTVTRTHDNEVNITDDEDYSDGGEAHNDEAQSDDGDHDNEAQGDGSDDDTVVVELSDGEYEGRPGVPYYDQSGIEVVEMAWNPTTIPLAWVRGDYRRALGVTRRDERAAHRASEQGSLQDSESSHSMCSLNGLSQSDLRYVMSLPDSRFGRMAPYLDLIGGMPIQITQNIATSKGVANGTLGTLVCVHFPPNTSFQLVRDGASNTIVQLPSKPPEYAMVRIPRPQATAIRAGVDPELFPVFFKTEAYMKSTITLPKAPDGQPRSITVKPQQLPFVCAVGSTVYKVQGETLTSMVVMDWKSTQRVVNKPQQSYLLVSRVTSRNAFIALTPFTHELAAWSKPPVCALNEEERLIRLSNITLASFQSPPVLHSNSTAMEGIQSSPPLLHPDSTAMEDIR